MRIIQTSELKPGSLTGETELLWVYNALDCMLTFEIFQQIEPQLDNITRATYEFSKSLQGCVLDMKTRGVKVDFARRDEAVASFKADVDIIAAQLNRILSEGLDFPINYRSHQQLKKLFYSYMKIPPVKKRNSKGEQAPTVDREALEKLIKYFDAECICNHILKLRDFEKKISALSTEVDPDGRMRTSYNIAGTTTGRFSSSMNDFGGGGNFQNIEERLRSMFIADPGYKFAYIDLEQAESRAVGAIIYNSFGDSKYLDACESGDLHTYVCRLANPGLPWTGDLKKDKEIAEQPFYRQHSYRHMAKVLGHGSNYMGTPPTMHKHTKIAVAPIAQFQSTYFMAFPGIPRWHGRVRQILKDEGKLTSMMGTRRHFFGRPTDDTTVREAVAFDPQSSVAKILNTGMLNVWRIFPTEIQLLAQQHDAILIQYPEETENQIIPKILEAIKTPVELNGGRKLIIPSEAAVGWNWSKKTEKNSDGLVKFNGSDSRVRTKEVGLMDRVIYKIQ